MAHMVKTFSVSSVKQSEVEASEGQHITIRPESNVDMKKKLLQELASVQLLQKEFAELFLELDLKGYEAAENLNRVVNGFVRQVLHDSEKGNEESLLDAVKKMKRMIEQHHLGAKKDIEKAEKKQKKKDMAEKNHKKDKSKKKGI